MRDAVLFADAVEDVAAEHGLHGDVAATVFRQVGEGHAVVGQHGVDGVWKCCHHAPEEVRAVHLACIVPELDVGKLRHAVDGQEHVQLALNQTQLADVDVDIADRGLGEPAPFRDLLRIIGQAYSAARDC